MVPSPYTWVNAQGLVKIADALRFKVMEKILEKRKVIAFPKYLQGTTRKCLRSGFFGHGQSVHQYNFAIGAVRESLPVFCFTSRTEHDSPSLLQFGFL
jgi:hypothetical protein